LRSVEPLILPVESLVELDAPPVVPVLESAGPGVLRMPALPLDVFAWLPLDTAPPGVGVGAAVLPVVPGWPADVLASLPPAGAAVEPDGMLLLEVDGTLAEPDVPLLELGMLVVVPDDVPLFELDGMLEPDEAPPAELDDESVLLLEAPDILPDLGVSADAPGLVVPADPLGEAEGLAALICASLLHASKSACVGLPACPRHAPHRDRRAGRRERCRTLEEFHGPSLLSCELSGCIVSVSLAHLSVKAGASEACSHGRSSLCLGVRGDIRPGDGSGSPRGAAGAKCEQKKRRG
jgi:hypothetical protein